MELVRGSRVTVTTEEAWRTRCDAEHIWVDYANMSHVVAPGSVIYIDDGLVSLRVLELHGADIVCEVENGGLLGTQKKRYTLRGCILSSYISSILSSGCAVECTVD